MTTAGLRRRAIVALLSVLAGLPAVVLTLSAPAAAAAAPIACPNQDTPVTAANLAQARAAALCIVNAIRGEYGLPALADSPQLDASAQGHSADMVAKHYFEHVSPSGSTPPSRDSAAGYSGIAWGENIAEGAVTPYQVVTLWMSDVPHCSTVLSPTYRDIGLGIALGAPTAGVPGDTWTQDFGLRAGQSAPSSNTGPASSCPHPLPAAMSPAMSPAPGGGSGGGGSGGGGSTGSGHTAPASPIAAAALLVAGKGSLSERIQCIASQTCVLKVTITLEGAARATGSAAVHVRIAPHKTKTVRLSLSAAALGRALAGKHPLGYVTITVSAPAAGTISGVAQIIRTH